MEDNLYDVVKFRREGVPSFFEIYKNSAPTPCPTGRVMPFQIDLPAGVLMTGTKLWFRRYPSGVPYFINISAESEMFTDATRNKFVFFGKDITFADIDVDPGNIKPPDLTEGLHYFELTDSSGKVWKSELLHIKTCDFTLIKYRHSFADLGAHAIYQNLSTDFYYEIYVESETARPEYPYDEKGSEDAIATFKPDRQILEKIYKLELTGQEHIVDAVNSLRMHNDITIKDIYNRTYQVEARAVDQEWLNKDAWTSKIEIEFSASKVVILGCGDSVTVGSGGGPGGVVVTNPTETNNIELPSVFAFDDDDAEDKGVELFTPAAGVVPEKKHMYWQSIDTDLGAAGCLTVKLT